MRIEIRMNLLLPVDIAFRLMQALKKAGKVEIGGVMMGEHVCPNTFRVMDITIQRTGGTYATFVRFVEGIIGPLRSFFSRTNHNYTKFNYIGEWHSHHSFHLSPSPKDNKTMMDILGDPLCEANFIALMLVKITSDDILEKSVTVYQENLESFEGVVIVET